MAGIKTIKLLAAVYLLQVATAAAPKNANKCSCDPGYTGADCDVVIDNCQSGPCQNGGSCANGVNSYTCTCPPGYTNKQCQTVIDNCASGPCVYVDSCTNGVNEYTCTCLTGYTGINCDSEIDYCSDDTCQNGGTCTSSPRGFSCACPAGYTDPQCSTVIDTCEPNPCQNGGSCNGAVNSFTCVCPPGYAGTDCSRVHDNCWSGPCLNGGQCVNAVNSYTCVCETGYTGDNCGDVIDNCQGQCLNGASCTNGINTFTCQCAPGYMGSTCCRPDPCYFSNPCQNGGTCITTDTGYNCSCMAHWLNPDCSVLKGFSYRVCADDFITLYADGAKLNFTRSINATTSAYIPDGAKVLAVRAQNTFSGAGWKGVADDGRYPSSDLWKCTTETQVGVAWVFSNFDDSSWQKPYTKRNYNWMCPTYPSSSLWLWTDPKFLYLGYIYCRLQIQQSEAAGPMCTTHCLSCTTAGKNDCDPGQCDIGFGYTPSSKTCDMCAANCRVCSTAGSGKCDTTGCHSGFAYNADTNGCDPITFTTCADDTIYLYADGIYQTCANVPKLKDTDVVFTVPPGTQVLAAKVTNTQGNTGGWKGYLSAGRQVLNVTDSKWKCTSNVPSDDVSWRQASFDDSQWPQALTSDDINTFTNEKPPKPGCVKGYPDSAKFIWTEPTFSQKITVYCRRRLQ